MICRVSPVRRARQSQRIADSPSTVPMSKKPNIGLKFSLLNIGITALVTISMINVSSLAPEQWVGRETF